MERQHTKYQRLIDACKALAPTPTAVAHPCDESSLRGAVDAAKLGLIAPILVGPRARIEAIAKEHGIDIAGLQIVDTPHSQASAEKAVELVREGKVRYVGHSNLEAAQVEEIDVLARERGWARPVSAQNQYSLLRRDAEEELLPACERLGLGVLPYFPLASGLLTGKYRRGQPQPEGTRLAGRDNVFTDEAFDRIEALEEFGRERGLLLLQVAIGGLAAQPAVASVIAGATKPEQVRSNAAAGDWEPSSEDLAALNALR